MATRLDKFLLEKNYFETRSRAQNAIREGAVFLNGKVATKTGVTVFEGDQIEVKNTLKYVSRAGLKLEKAVKEFDLNLSGKTMLDIGSSTGGFVDCALKNNVKTVIAVDVGTDQLADKLRKDKNVSVYEKTDFRTIDNSLIESADIITIDVSFISVTLLLNKISQLSSVKEIVCLIKPQFECGKQIADKFKGVITDKNVHIEVIEKLLIAFENIGFNVVGLSFSPIVGKKGNVEYLAYFKKEKKERANIFEVVDNAFKNL